MKKNKRIHRLEKKVKALEKIITSNSLTLTDPDNPGEQIVLDYKSGNYKLIHRKTTVSIVEEQLNNITD